MYELVIFLAGAATTLVAASLLLVPRLWRSEAIAAARARELSDLRADRQPAASDATAAENAELRRRMDELADAILAGAGHPAPPPPLRPEG